VLEYCAQEKQDECFAEAQHLIVNETVRYNVELTHVDLDCSCLRLHKLLHPFIIANGYPCDAHSEENNFSKCLAPN